MSSQREKEGGNISKTEIGSLQLNIEQYRASE